MDYRRLEESQIADYEIGTLSVDYVRHTITIELKSPQNRLDILQIAHFEEVSITKKEPWGLEAMLLPQQLSIVENILF